MAFSAVLGTSSPSSTGIQTFIPLGFLPGLDVDGGPGCERPPVLTLGVVAAGTGRVAREAAAVAVSMGEMRVDGVMTPPMVEVRGAHRDGHRGTAVGDDVRGGARGLVFLELATGDRTMQRVYDPMMSRR